MPPSHQYPALRLLTNALLAGLAIALSACATQTVGVPPSENKPIAVYPGDTRAYYTDGDTSHVITLMANGAYTFESSAYDGSVTSRQGNWGWKSLGTHNAELTLDSNVWNLSFIDHYSAIAVNTSANSRTFAFQFERL